MLKILYIEDDIADQMSFKRIIKKCDFEYELETISTIEKAQESISGQLFDLIFCDFNLPDGTALDLLNENDIDLPPTIILTSQADLTKAIETLKLGAFDFITKDGLTTNILNRLIRSISQIIEQKNKSEQLELALENSYANTRAILNNTSDGIWSINPKGKIILINKVGSQRFITNFNYEPKEGDSLFEKVPSPINQIWMGIFNRAIKGETVTSVNKYETLTGKFYLEIICSPLFDNKKNIEGVIFFARDITEREKSEKRIRESERNFRSIFEGSEVSIIIERIKDNKIVDLNQSAAEMHGYSLSQMIGMSIFDTIPPEYLEESQKNYVKYLKGDIDLLDSYVFTSDKNSIPVQVSINKIKYNGEKCNLLFLQNITMRKDAESKLESARQLAERNAEFKSNFLANMSHEIRTPMNAMMGFTELLKNTTLNSEQKDFVKTISASGEDLLVIINDILDLSKIQAGKLELRLSNFSFSSLLEKIISLHSAKANHKKLKLSFEVGKEVPEWLLGDKVRITQIINNIVSNAIKFTIEGGVDISVSRVSKVNENILIKITDTGIGIPEKNLESIFDDFSQIDSSLQREQQGTGLGLVIVSNFCRMMKGTLKVLSKHGKGSTFIVELPLSIGEKPKKEKEVVYAKDLKGLRVLVVEDNELNTMLAKKVLDNLSAISFFAINGVEAINQVKLTNPDIVLMDIQLPIMNGIEATIKIREFSTVPILAMSAHVMESERDKCLEAGMDGFIPKPFKINDIISTISEKITLSHIKVEEAIEFDLANLKMPSLLDLAEGDSEFIRTVLDMYLNNTPEELLIFKKAVASDDTLNQIHVAHKLRSSFKMLELKELAEISVKIENKQSTEEELLHFALLIEQSFEHIANIRKKLN